MRWERKAFLTIDADSEEEAGRAITDVDGLVVGDGVMVSVDDGALELIDEDE